MTLQSEFKLNENQTFTENGAISNVTTHNHRLDLFFKSVRGLTKESLIDMLEKAWTEDALDTVKLIFYCRDCRGGKGEREIFHTALIWLATKSSDTITKNLSLISEFGYYKDYLYLFNTSVEGDVIKYLVQQLVCDYDNMMLNKPISLLSKWLPSEKSPMNKTYRIVNKMCRVMGITYKEYRTKYISPLRKYLNIVERLVCSGGWLLINYETIPSLAHHKYKKLFMKYDSVRYNKYLEKVKSGNADIKCLQLFPHTLVCEYLNGELYNETTELMWNKYVDSKRQLTDSILNDAIAMVDVSGSMTTCYNGSKVKPIQVAVSLGLLISELNTGFYHNQFLSFSGQPTLETVKGNTLKEKVNGVMTSKWGMNTNLQSAIDLLLKNYDDSNHPIPRTIFILSDMQFDEATRSNTYTNDEVMRTKFELRGLHVPKIVYWNLNAYTIDFPATQNSPNTILLSGFSVDVLKMLDYSCIGPYEFLRATLDTDRLNKIKL